MVCRESGAGWLGWWGEGVGEGSTGMGEEERVFGVLLKEKEKKMRVQYV